MPTTKKSSPKSSSARKSSTAKKSSAAARAKSFASRHKKALAGSALALALLGGGAYHVSKNRSGYEMLLRSLKKGKGGPK